MAFVLQSLKSSMNEMRQFLCVGLTTVMQLHHLKPLLPFCLMEVLSLLHAVDVLLLLPPVKVLSFLHLVEVQLLPHLVEV